MFISFNKYCHIIIHWRRKKTVVASMRHQNSWQIVCICSLCSHCYQWILKIIWRSIRWNSINLEFCYSVQRTQPKNTNGKCETKTQHLILKNVVRMKYNFLAHSISILIPICTSVNSLGRNFVSATYCSLHKSFNFISNYFECGTNNANGR